MSSPRIALSRASTGVLGRLITTSAPRTRPCENLLRQFSHYQPWYSPSDKLQATPSYQPYPLNPNRNLPSQPRNDPIPETSIASPIPKVHETRPPAPAPTPTLAHRDTTIATTATTDTTTVASQPRSSVTEQETQKAKPKSTPPKRKLRPRKAALKLTPSAVEQLRVLLDNPEPKLIKVGVRNRGCSGLSYHFDYVDEPGAFDEEVEQDGVKVLIDSKALFSIIGSEMDWVEDKLNQRFIFRNPNIKEECGCGESFMV
ncbi:iron-binding protein iscA [Annulohypoxylon maeteangense]|uniref:iron-binding protein iscA n=1 Tax=Annulohypoxylon maeteangense TaxID=1927788 RepID=UPI002008B1E2|nr:iron-binding protein iscA [Annulohypoxylon maeteangense]KAI0879871.1 iron-binding protein iscA [Annulohypoxylon maeteangense]